MSGRTPARDEAIMQLRGKGYSLRMIASELSLSRGCVSSVICRARNAGDERGVYRRPVVEVKRKAPATLTPRRKKAARAPVAPPAPVLVPVTPPGSFRLHFLDIRRSGQCRFPMWNDDDTFADKFYCGNTTGKDEVYCPACRKVIYGPGTPSEQAAIRDARKAA